MNTNFGNIKIIWELHYLRNKIDEIKESMSCSLNGLYPVRWEVLISVLWTEVHLLPQSWSPTNLSTQVYFSKQEEKVPGF